MPLIIALNEKKSAANLLFQCSAMLLFQSKKVIAKILENIMAVYDCNFEKKTKNIWRDILFEV